jgi:cyclic pyranopterin phosphate synthase
MPGADPPGSERAADLSHVEQGPEGARSCMVDVGDKDSTAREALAEACLRFPPQLRERVMAGEGPKGPVTEVARVAGILAAKRTGELIPMCHPLGLDHVEILFEALEEDPDLLRITCRASCQGRTGVEMEAMTGATVAALTVYDMTKALAKGIELERVRLLSKKGGKSGVWRAS